MLINGRYRLQNKLGEGGMAEVWLALDEFLERPVAVKRLRAEFAHDETFLRRFNREAKLVAKLNSPHIVQIYDVAISGEARFIAMEYVEGQDLNALLEEEAPLLPERALRLLRDIADGIAEAHEAGLVHRDLKPANVLISKRGQVKITDFGIARDPSRTALTAPGLVWGTSYYMAPEQVMGKPPTPAMDVYALGVLLFEMLSGQLPYPGDDAMAVSMAHIHQPVPSVRALQSSISVELDRLVQRLMAKEPAERPQNGRELLRILEGFLSGGIQTVVHPVQMPHSEAATRQWGTPSQPQPQPQTRQWGVPSQTHPPSSREQRRNTSSFRLTGAMVAAVIVLCLFIGMGGLLISGIFGNSGETGSASSGGVVMIPTFTPTPTFTPSLTPTVEPSVAVSSRPSPTIPPATATLTPTPPEIASATFTALPTETSTVSPSATAIPTVVPSATLIPTVVPSATATPTVVPSATATPSISIRPAETVVNIGGGREGNGPDAYALGFTTGARVKIDGNLSEWDKSEPVPLLNPVFQRENWKGAIDLSGKAYFAWDESSLYLAIERVDDEHLQTNSGHELYRDDSVELWLDTDLEGDFFWPEANEDDFQFVFSAGDFASLKAEGVTYNPNRDERQLAVASQRLGTSYTLEIRIPWVAIGVMPRDEMILGYAVVLNDNDSPQSEEPKTQVASNLEGAYLKPRTFGNLILLR